MRFVLNMHFFVLFSFPFAFLISFLMSIKCSTPKMSEFLVVIYILSWCSVLNADKHKLRRDQIHNQTLTKGLEEFNLKRKWDQLSPCPKTNSSLVSCLSEIQTCLQKAASTLSICSNTLHLYTLSTFKCLLSNFCGDTKKPGKRAAMAQPLVGVALF